MAKLILRTGQKYEVKLTGSHQSLSVQDMTAAILHKFVLTNGNNVMVLGDNIASLEIDGK